MRIFDIKSEMYFCHIWELQKSPQNYPRLWDSVTLVCTQAHTNTRIPSKNQYIHCLQPRGLQVNKLEACLSLSMIRLTASTVVGNSTKGVLPLTRSLTLDKSLNLSNSVSPSINSDDYNTGLLQGLKEKMYVTCLAQYLAHRKCSNVTNYNYSLKRI